MIIIYIYTLHIYINTYICIRTIYIYIMYIIYNENHVQVP